MLNLRKMWRIIMICIVAGTTMLPLSQSAQARNLFDFIFGNRKKEQQLQPKKPVRKPVRKKNTQMAVQPKQQPKAENAQRILIIGDFAANALADGLTQLYADHPDVIVISRANPSSGIVRDDYYDWNKEIPAILDKEKPNIIIMMIGANDNQTMRIDGGLEPETDAFKTAYTKRLTTIANSLKNSGKPWIWMGQPAYKQNNLTQNLIAFNGLYKEQAEKANGQFIDIWNGFVDDKGNFALSGYDVSGKTVRLRANDGINFTQAGRQKLAFYAEKPLQDILKLATPNSTTTPPINEAAPLIPVTTLPRNIDRIAPMGLYDMAKSNNGLLGDINTPEKPTDETAWTPKNGKQNGRVDHYSLQPSSDK